MGQTTGGGCAECHVPCAETVCRVPCAVCRMGCWLGGSTPRFRPSTRKCFLYRSLLVGSRRFGSGRVGVGRRERQDLQAGTEIGSLRDDMGGSRWDGGMEWDGDGISRCWC
jgi:hypothetical protein